MDYAATIEAIEALRDVVSNLADFCLDQAASPDGRISEAFEALETADAAIARIKANGPPTS